MNDYNIKKYFDSIIQITNNSGLTPGEAFFVLRCVVNELEKAYLETAKEPMKEEEKAFDETIHVSADEDKED